MYKFINKLYFKLPVLLQNLFITIYGFTWKNKRFGGVFEAEKKLFLSREFYCTEEWEKYQVLKLRELLIHSILNVPYYSKLFKENGITVENIKQFNLSQLGSIPYLEKNTLRMEGKSSLLSNTIDKNGEFFASSGSTGTPTQIYFSRKFHQTWSAVFETRIRWWAGVNNKTPRGTIGGRRVLPEGDGKRPFFRYNFFEKQTYFSAYHISKNNADNYLKGIVDNKVDYMTGYAMSNYFLARFIEESNLKAPKLKAVITSSEKLTKEMRDTFRRVYNCETYDSYSGVEACGLISQCEKGNLHMSPDVAIIEIIKEDGTYAKPGESGEAVCTGLLNYDQPLIRYRIGDVLTLSTNQNCDCGRSMPIIEEIVGRIEDTVIGADGREMVRFHGIFINIPSIVEGQIIQFELRKFEINVVVFEPLKVEEKELIIQRMISQLGGSIEVEISEVREIPRNANGKFKAVISHVKR